MIVWLGPPFWILTTTDQGGLEIKVAVTFTWEVAQGAKFILLRGYIKKWYEFRNSLTQDDSKDILEKLEKKIKSNNANDNDIDVNDDTIDIDLIDTE
jgi:hypothetical protein